MGPFILSAEQIVPRIVLDLPTGVSADVNLSGDDSPIERHLVADLSVTYAFDLPKIFQIVARRDLIRLGLIESEIHELALQNLGERMVHLAPDFLELENDIFLLRSGGDFEATMLLFDHVWQQAETMIHGELVVSVPARDSVAFTGAFNKQGLAFMRSQVSRILETGNHTLTRHFLARRNDKWVKYEGYAS